MVLLAAALVGCSGGGGTTGPSATQIAVGGDYVVAVALAENGCGTVTVAPQPTRVDHAPGATRFTLSHAGTYSGTLAAGGAFTTDARVIADGGGSTTVRIEGRFTTGGLEARVTVDLAPAAPGAACRYVVSWQGTKQGAPNVIP
jgi:hypothetical protein